ncbi:MAG: Na/Pi cotransporter family protein [Rikenella sp.]|nr:Na/Pi cotransporter family protein [Rikenella sp.]
MELFIRLLNIIGSLGLFLYGMKLMSDALQRIAGSRLRRTMGRIAATPLSQITSTAAVTATVQSSSAITVMIVSFVNARIVNLRQAIGMIMGANIGTTATAWLVALFGFALDFSVISIPLVGLGFALILIRKNHYRELGETLTGFALMLLGLAVLQSAMGAIAIHTGLFRALSTYADLGYLSIVLFLLIGLGLTAVLQSSSATIVLTIILCQNGWIPFEAGAAMILGENIGTTVTALLASMTTHTQAKRAALFHTLFNATGALWAVPLLPWLAQGIDGLFAGMNRTAAMPFMLALFHSGFNLLNVCLTVGFISPYINLLNRLVHRPPAEGRKRLLTLDSGLLSSPELSLMQAQNEVVNQAERLRKMFSMARSLTTITQGQEFQQVYEHVEKYERITNRVEREIVAYLSRIASQDKSDRTARRLQRLFRAAACIERIGDGTWELARTLKAKREGDIWFPQELRERLEELFDLTEQALYWMAANIASPMDEGVERAREIAARIGHWCHVLHDGQLAEAQSGEEKLSTGFAVLELVRWCREIGTTATRVSVEIAEDL